MAGGAARAVVDAPFAAADARDVPISAILAVNVAEVPQRSPLRYPGGKTWLIPHIRAWLGDADGADGSGASNRLLIEPFAGGGTVSLTGVMEHYAERALMAELDADVAAFWQAALAHGPNLIELVRNFDPTYESVEALQSAAADDVVMRGFRTLVLNRVRRGGILAPGASLSRAGENGKGLRSRWYPDTLVRRLTAIWEHAERLTFVGGDGMKVLRSLDAATLANCALFLDPPYTAGGKRAGARLYAHHEIDHRALFAFAADCGADFLMTYDCAPETLALVREFGFHAVQVVMKNTHHARIAELVITRRKLFVDPCRRTAAGVAEAPPRRRAAQICGAAPTFLMTQHG